MSEDLFKALLDSLPHPLLLLDEKANVVKANLAAEQFFNTSERQLMKHGLEPVLPFGSPVLALIAQVMENKVSMAERRVDISSPKIGSEKQVDVFATPLQDMPNHTMLLLEARSVAEKIDRQLNHRGAARTVTGLAAMLAHEIKNPLSGIKGAAQLLEGATDNDDDRALTKLIEEETDRIVKLVDRMEYFSDERMPSLKPVNIHSVLEHVRLLAENGFASHIKLSENYDPSLPELLGNRDQLIQMMLNLVKNASEAIGHNSGGEIQLSTSYRPGMRLAMPHSPERVELPLEFTITDNGGGIPNDIMPNLFDPFVTTKTNGSGLGLALVAKVVRDHGGIVECDSHSGKTTFRILMPIANASYWEDADQHQLPLET